MKAMAIGLRPNPSESGPQTSCAKAKPAKYSDSVSLTAASVVPKACTISGIAGVNNASEIGPTAASMAQMTPTRVSLIDGFRAVG